MLTILLLSGMQAKPPYTFHLVSKTTCVSRIDPEWKDERTCHLPSEPLLPPNSHFANWQNRAFTQSLTDTVISTSRPPWRDSFLSSRVRPLPLFPGSLLPPHLSIFFSALLPTSPPTFDYSGCFRTYRRQDLFFIKSECSSPQEVQMPKIFTKKDLYKVMDEKTSGL